MSIKQVLKKVRKIYLKDHPDTPWVHGLPKELGITYQSFANWELRGRMPDSEYSGRTRHAINIQRILNNQVTVIDLLGHVPVAIQDEVAELDKRK